MTDAFEAQGELAPVQSIHNNEFSAVTSEVPVLEALDAASTQANEVLEVADQDAQTSDASRVPRGPATDSFRWASHPNRSLPSWTWASPAHDRAGKR